jgi:hypothetical protein
VRFWLDVWLGQCPLSVVYNNIFQICNEQNSTVYEVFFRNNEINLTFKRSFGTVEMEEWNQLLDHINDVQFRGEVGA